MDKTTFDNLTDEQKEELYDNHDCYLSEEDGCEVCAWYDLNQDDMDDDS